MVDSAFRILIMGFRGECLAHPVRRSIDCGTDRSDICGPKFDLRRTPEHGHRSRSHDIQIITLDPELINAVRNLKGQRDFIRLHQFNCCKPSLERIGAEMRPDSVRYFPPKPTVSLLHRCFYSRPNM